MVFIHQFHDSVSLWFKVEKYLIREKVVINAIIKFTCERGLLEVTGDGPLLTHSVNPVAGLTSMPPLKPGKHLSFHK